MRLKISKSKNSTNFYIIKDCTKNGKRSTKVVHKIGNLKTVKNLAGEKDYNDWLKDYVKKYNDEHNEKKDKIIIKKYTNKRILKNVKTKFDIGHLFLKRIYYELKLNDICYDLNKKYQFKFDLNDILSYLIYKHVFYPSLNLDTPKLFKNFLLAPDIKLDDIYLGLATLNKEIDYIQEKLLENNLDLIKKKEFSKIEPMTSLFLIDYLASLIYKVLEKKLNYKYSLSKILKTLTRMKVHVSIKDCYIPLYIRTNITDDLHDAFGFRTDYEILNYKYINKIHTKISN